MWEIGKALRVWVITLIPFESGVSCGSDVMGGRDGDWEFVSDDWWDVVSGAGAGSKGMSSEGCRDLDFCDQKDRVCGLA